MINQFKSCLLLLLAGSSSVTAQGAFDFRKTYWGMSERQVRDMEGIRTKLERYNFLSYTVKHLGRLGTVEYRFERGGLTGGAYKARWSFAGTRAREGEYDRHYEYLTKRHGKPANEIKANYPGGLKVWYAIWRTERSVISLSTHSYSTERWKILTAGKLEEQSIPLDLVFWSRAYWERPKDL